MTTQISINEKDIEKSICDYLATKAGGFVCQIELSGRPIRKGHKTILIPFQGKHYYIGMSDILYLFKGALYALEVKTPKEHKYIVKHYDKIINTPRYLLNKKQQHLHDQITFIENIKRAGGNGDFVSSVNQVKSILNFTT